MAHVDEENFLKEHKLSSFFIVMKRMTIILSLIIESEPIRAYFDSVLIFCNRWLLIEDLSGPIDR